MKAAAAASELAPPRPRWTAATLALALDFKGIPPELRNLVALALVVPELARLQAALAGLIRGEE